MLCTEVQTLAGELLAKWMAVFREGQSGNAKSMYSTDCILYGVIDHALCMVRCKQLASVCPQVWVGSLA